VYHFKNGAATFIADTFSVIILLTVIIFSAHTGFPNTFWLCGKLNKHPVWLTIGHWLKSRPKFKISSSTTYSILAVITVTSAEKICCHRCRQVSYITGFSPSQYVVAKSAQNHRCILVRCERRSKITFTPGYIGVHVMMTA